MRSTVLNRAVVAGLAWTALAGIDASAQTPSAPVAFPQSAQSASAQVASQERQGQVPIFRAAVVARTTQAVNYRPRQGDTRIDFTGTALMPGGIGNATVSGEKGYVRIDAKFDKLQPPPSFGREYLTYVLWAITPEGRATNLGEVQFDDKDARVKVTTELQAFGMIVTAEPYFAVTQPSDVVVLENTVRDNTKGKVETIQARYELLQRGMYLLSSGPENFKVKALEPGAPLDLAQARNAVELARLAGADRYAQDSFSRASRLLADAETAREKKRSSNDIMMPARQAAQTAEDARLVAMKQREEERVAQERADSLQRERVSLDREREALERARIEEGRRQQAELAARNEQDRARQAQLDAEAARLRAAQDAQAEQERARQAQLDAEAVKLQAAQQAQAEQERARQAQLEADAVKQQAAQETQAEQERRRQAEAAAAAAEKERTEALAARASAEEAQRAAVTARAVAEAQAQQAQAAVAKSETEKQVLRTRVQEQLNVILETRESARGLVVNLSDVLFDTGSSTLKPGAREKLARVAGVLLAYPGLQVAVEGHTDSVGSEGLNQQLSESRAQSVHDYLLRQGIPPNTVGTSGLGESQPVASNGTAAGRQQNRRVELVVSGEAIGR